MATPRNNSVRKAFTLLKAFQPAEVGMTCGELSRKVQIPEGSSYRLLQTLEEIGVVTRDRRGRYRPGLQLVSLSHNVAVNDCLQAAGREILSGLSQRFDVTAHLARLEGGMVYYVAKFATPQSCQTQTFPGAQFEPYSSALGKVLLSALPRHELDAFMADGELVPLTPHTITDKAAFRAELEKARCRGFALDDREFRTDISCVSVPVQDNGGRTVAAMSITERPENMARRRGELCEALLQAAEAFSRKVYPAPVSLLPATA